jgi:hypothetical protein
MLGAARIDWEPIDPTNSPAPDFPTVPKDALFGLSIP